MSFTDPLSITISGVTSSLPRTNTEGDETSYQSGDGLIVVSAAHTVGKQNRNRRVLRIDTSKITADPFRPAENVKVTMSNYVVFDTPPAGYSPAEILAVHLGFRALMSASSDTIITKLLGGES